MSCREIHFIASVCFLLLFASCVDQKGFHACEAALEESIANLVQVQNMREAIEIDDRLNETLNKYGHSPMTRKMIGVIKEKHELYLKTKKEVYKRINNEDSILRKRIINVPNVGEVEFKAPPEA